MIPSKHSLIKKCLIFHFFVIQIIFSGCEQQVEIQEEVKEERFSISDLIQENLFGKVPNQILMNHSF